MKLLEDPCESCAVEEGEIVLETEHGDLFVCHKCAKRLRKARKKVNHGNPPVE